MRTGLILSSFFGYLFPAVAGGVAWRANAKYIDLPYAAQAQTMAADSAGNLFIVSNVTEPSGRPQIRVTKTDPSGVTFASIDFGGSVSLLDIIAGVAIDPQGDVVIAGTTSSPDFPLVSPLISRTGPQSAFIVKIDSQLRNILFSTRLGGTTGGPPLHGGTLAQALAIDQGGNIYVTGETYDTDFPVTPGAFQTKAPQSDAFGSASYAYLTEITADGHKIVFSTFFGDSHVNCGGANCNGAFGFNRGSGIAFDSEGNVIIAGPTDADRLPVTLGVFGPRCGACTVEVSTSFLAKFLNLRPDVLRG